MQAYEILFLIMLGVFGVSLLYPWHPQWPGARLLTHLPIVLLPIWGLYEMVLPPEMNIRVDLLLIWFGLGIAGMVYVFRQVLFFVLRNWMAAGEEIRGND